MTDITTPQLTPNWEQDYNTEQFAADLGRPCMGGGFYLTDSDTMLVIPQGVPPEQTWWHANRLPADTVWRAHTWNAPFRDTIWAHMGLVPTRLDTRHHEQPVLFQRMTRPRMEPEDRKDG